ncbi:MAG: fibronectin type III domain-containing protein, partial [Spirochaetaceae bacterium]|nr:fibronectin type III domain-containing protein [Spirochaetaceae bacterium]
MKAIKVIKNAENFAFLHFTARLIMPCAKFLGAAFPGALAAAIFCAAALGALFISCEQPDSFGSFFYYEKGLRAPGGVKAVAGNGLVTLSWLPVGALITEEYEYEVFYNTSNSIPAAPFWTGRNFTTIVSPLTNRTAYYFWVRAVMGGKKGDFSEPVKAIPWLAGTEPDTPAAPRIITGIERLTVVWEITGGAAQYEVYYSTSAAAPASPAQTVSVTSATINGLFNGQIYYFWIKAKNGSLVSALSQPQTGIPRAATSPPGVPGKPELESGSGKMSLRWNPAEMASVYEVYYSTNQERSSSPAVSGLGETSATVSGLQNGQRYYFWVRATNGLGAGGFSPSASGTPSAFAEAPAAPAAPSVTPGSGRLFVSWQAAEGALSYELWWGTTDNSAGAVKYGSDFSVTSAEVSCANGVTRYFWLKAKNEKGASGFGACANGTPSAIYAPPAAPAAPAVTAGNEQLTLNWTAVEGAQAYELWLGTTNNSAEAGRRADVAATSAVISGLTNNTVYYIWLKAKNAAGSSGFSLRSSGTPQASLGPPQTPGQPALALGSGQFTVSWNAVEGADAYEVYLGTSAEFASAAKNGGDVTTLSKTISGLTNGTTYYVWVKAKNSLGASAESTSRSAIPIAAASAPTVTAENTRLTLAWTAVAGASQYEVYYSTGTTIPAA